MDNNTVMGINCKVSPRDLLDVVLKLLMILIILLFL